MDSPPDFPYHTPPASRVQAKLLPARQGLDWIKQGWHLFRRQPMALTGILSMFIFAMLLASLVLNFIERGLMAIVPAVIAQIVAGLGAAWVAATVPGITAGFMTVCKNVLAGKPIRFDQMLQVFKGSRRIRNHLLVLGGIQVMALVLVMAITPDAGLAAPDAGATSATTSTATTATTATTASSANPAENDKSVTSPASTTATQPADSDTKAASKVSAGNPATSTDDELQLEGMSLEQREKVLLIAALQMLLYMPITVLLWYAPMLVYWQDCSAIKAMFFSAAAVWRNRAAFTVYGVGLSLILFIAAYLMAMLLVLFGLLLGIGKTSLALLAPFVMVLLTWTYCTIYFSYTSVFGDPQKLVTSE